MSATKEKYLTGLDVTGPNHQQRGLSAQSVKLPDKYEDLGGYKVRYRVYLDTSYLEQSRAAVDVWHSSDLCWNEVAKLQLDKEFYLADGPPTPDALNPLKNELAKTVSINSKGADFVAESWEKVYRRLAKVAGNVLF